MSLDHVEVELLVKPFGRGLHEGSDTYGTVIGLQVATQTKPLEWQPPLGDMEPHTLNVVLPGHVADNMYSYVETKVADPQVYPGDRNCIGFALASAGIVPPAYNPHHLQTLLSPAADDTTPVNHSELEPGGAYGMADNTQGIRHMFVGLPDKDAHLAIRCVGGPLEVRSTAKVTAVWGSERLYHVTQMPVAWKRPPRDTGPFSG
ncbi:MAG TPA: hypothetical protein VK674_04730 [Candidatus Limnocylindria bacterium]|nr:hypothetical protein [Candidatus Limnocylindria bacterium]